MNKLEKLGYKKLNNNLYEYHNSYIVFAAKSVFVKDKEFDIEFLEAILSSRPKSYAGRKALPIPANFKEDCLKGLTYPQLMKKYNVARRTIAKWKRLI